MSTTNFRSQLIRQLGFLYASCQRYDDGFHDEAIRIAVTIRVLIHETKVQTPLLRHLDAMHIELASTCAGASERAVIYSGMGSIRLSGAGPAYFPNLNVQAIERQLPVANWWSQTISVQGTVRLSRRDVVLGAANTDGGAHVDSKAPRNYEALQNADGGGFWSIVAPGTTTPVPITDAHLVFLRQMGFELQSSPQLLALARI